jgi:hypothetical protein
VCMTFSPLLFTAAVSISAIERNARSVTHSSIHRCILVVRIVGLKWVAQEGLHFSRVASQHIAVGHPATAVVPTPIRFTTPYSAPSEPRPPSEPQSAMEAKVIPVACFYSVLHAAIGQCTASVRNILKKRVVYARLATKYFWRLQI